MNFHPPMPARHARPLNSFQFMGTLSRNPLAVWSNEVYETLNVRYDFMGAPLVVISEPAGVRRILLDNVGNYVLDPLRQRILKPILGEGLLTAEGDLWKRTRKSVASAFVPRHINAFGENMRERADACASELTQAAGSVRDMSDAMTLLTYDILQATIFSGDIPDNPRDFAHAVAELLKVMARVDPMDVLDAPKFVPRLRILFGRKWLDHVRGIIRRAMANRKQVMAADPAAAPQDFLTLLLKADGLSDDEIEDNIITFIGAGHETTARGLAWGIYLLSQVPEERALVEAELDAHDFSTDPAGWGEALPYTRALFEESMRLYPPIPTLNRFAVEDDRIGDMEVPKGAAVLVLPWVIHRHEKLWDDPNAFMPSRFLPGNRERIDHRFQYLPFGAGPRVCIGGSFGMQEGVIALACLLRNLRFDYVGKAPPAPVQKISVQPANGLPMKVSRRN